LAQNLSREFPKCAIEKFLFENKFFAIIYIFYSKIKIPALIKKVEAMKIQNQIG